MPIPNVTTMRPVVPGATPQPVVTPASDTIPSYIIQPGQTPKQVEMRRRLAESLMQQGTSSAPVQGGWIEALARPLTAGIAGMQEYGAAQEEQKGKRSAAQALSQALTGDRVQPQQLANFFANDWADPAQQSLMAGIYETQQKTDLQEHFRPATPQEKAAYGVKPDMPLYISDKTGKPGTLNSGTSITIGADQRKANALAKSIGNDFNIVQKDFGALSDPGSQIGQMLKGVPGAEAAGRLMQTPEYQRVSNALYNIIYMHNYLVSGASSSQQEIAAKVQSMMPQFGEAPEAVADKLGRIQAMVQAVQEAGGGAQIPGANGSVTVTTGGGDSSLPPDL